MPIKLNVAAIISLCFIITSCQFNTAYVPAHPIHVPKSWHTKNKKFVTKNCSLPCMAWWKQFHDPMLNQLIDIGLQQNNDIQIAIANIEAAQGELKRIQLNWVPVIGGNMGYSSFPYLGYPGVLITAVPTYTLNIFSQIKEQKKARYELLATASVQDAVKLTVIAQITGSYFSYLAQIERLTLLEQIENDLATSMRIYRQTYQHGLTSDISLAEANSHLDLIKSEIMIIKKNIVINQNAIRYLLNDNPGSFVFTQTFAHLNSNQVIIGALPLNIIENRPDMKQALSELKAANANAAIAVSHFLPTIQLSAARGDIATVPNGSALGTPIYFNQALLQTPLLSLSTFGEWDKAKGLSKASFYRYQNTLRKVLRDVNNDLAAHDYYSQRLDQTIHAKNNLAHVYHLNHKLHKQGIISYAKLLEEKVKLDKIKIRVNQHKLEQMMTIVNLYQDLAAGYGCHAKSPSHLKPTV